MLIATESCHVQAFTASGQPLWRYEVVHAATTACAADVQGDGRDEVLAASEYWSWHGIQPDGTALFRVRGVESSGAAAVGTCRRPGTGQRLALFGGWDGHLTAYAPDGERVWDVPLGDIITTANGVDFDGQGQEDVLVAARSGYVYRYGADGQQRWRRRLGRAVAAALWLPTQRAIIAAAGNDLVWLDPVGEIIGRVTLPERVVQLHRWRGAGTEAVIAQDATGVLRAVTLADH